MLWLTVNVLAVGRLELISELQHAYPASLPSHRQLAAAVAPLTDNNTAPIRFSLDFASLYETTAPKWSSCFAIGAWYRRGIPRNSQSPPDDGIETCTPGGRDCWGKCKSEDLITPASRDLMIQVVTTLAAEVSQLFAVRPLSSKLRFDTGEGKYQRALYERGWTPTAGCASDCTMLSGVAVDASKYCGEGVDADAVISLRRPPVEADLLGTGSHCQCDPASGRPTWLVLNWIEETTSLAGRPVESLVDEYRHLVLHEVCRARPPRPPLAISPHLAHPSPPVAAPRVRSSSTRSASPTRCSSPLATPRGPISGSSRSSPSSTPTAPPTRCGTSPRGGRTRWRRPTLHATTPRSGKACR